MAATTDLTLAEKGLQTPVLADENTKPVWGPDLIDQVSVFILVPFILLKVPRSMNIWSRRHCRIFDGSLPTPIRSLL